VPFVSVAPFLLAPANQINSGLPSNPLGDHGGDRKSANQESDTTLIGRKRDCEHLTARDHPLALEADDDRLA
jgi:hypothetical protein